MTLGTEKAELIEQILDLEQKVYRVLQPKAPKEWLSLDITIAQLRVMLILFTDGPARMGVLASSLGVSLATATGITDRLVRRNLVLREGDPQDRRVVVCKLSERGQELIDRLWGVHRARARSLLEKLPPPKLQLVARGLEAILEAALALEQEARARLGERRRQVYGSQS